MAYFESRPALLSASRALVKTIDWEEEA